MRKSRVRFIVQYTVLFVAIALFVYYPFFKNDRSFIWNPDALGQHYNALVYIGEWLRGIVASIASGTPEVKLWEHGFGYGADVWTNLQFYVIADPLTLLSAFVPEKYTEYLYDFLCVFRLYLAGIAFSAYCWHMRAKDDHGVLAGALAYAFCGYGLYCAVRHPFFINAMILLPLLFIGVERVREGKGSGFFVLAVFFSAIVNFYLFYTLVIFVAVYAYARFAMDKGRRTLKRFGTYTARFLGLGIIGALMAAVVLVPLILLFTGASRASVERAFETWYTRQYYENFITSFFSRPTATFWTLTGFAAPTMVALFALYGSKKKHLVLQIAFVCFTILLIIPFAGRALNGFSYVSNRWSWAYAFIVCFILAWMWPDLHNMSLPQKIVCGVCIIVYTAIAYYIHPDSRMHSIYISSAIAAACFVMLLIVAKLGANRPRLHTAASWVLIAACVAGIMSNAYYFYTPKHGNYVSEFIESGTLWDLVSETPLKDAAERIQADGEFSREEQDAFSAKNTGDFYSVSSTQFYWSLANGNVSRYHKELGVGSGQADFNYESLEQRAYLEALAAVKYYYSNALPAPYGFEKVGEYTAFGKGGADRNYTVYRNTLALPLGYTFDSYFTQDTWNSLDFSARQEALLQSALVEGDALAAVQRDASGVQEATTENLNIKVRNVDYKVETSKGVSFDGNTFTVESKQGTATLTFEGLPNAETYLCVQGYNVDNLAKDREKPDYSHWGNSRFDTPITGDVTTKRLRYVTPYNTYNSGWHDYMINLGYSEAPQTHMTFQFPSTGEYSFDSMRVMCLPMDGYAALIAKRTQDQLQNVQMKTNAITGTISVSSDTILCLSIPYTTGWQVKVDGQPATAIKVNGMFTGVPLAQGEHTVEFTYFTPGLVPGMALSAVGLALFVALLVFQRKRRNRLAPKHEKRALT